MIGLEQCGQGCQHEGLRADLGKDPDAGKCAQQTIEGTRIRAGGRGQLVAAFGPLLQRIGDAELGRYVDRLSDPGPRII